LKYVFKPPCGRTNKLTAVNSAYMTEMRRMPVVRHNDRDHRFIHHILDFP